MPRNLLPIVTLAMVGGVVWLGWGSASGDEVDFNRDVRPIFNERCVACHGGVRQQAGLSLLFRADAVRPAESGRSAVVPGDPGASELLRRVTHRDPHQRMPKEGAALSDDEVARLRRWIEQGARWEAHWAYVAPVDSGLPEVSDDAWPHNGIDRFVAARLDEEGMTPSPPADCRTLLRRVSLDLVGLPAAPDELASVCRDGSPETYERFVDRLLESPRFGERWAAMWLDLARYADSTGYEKDGGRTIWRYRDWVIAAFNRDLPFDQFTVEQLAGDLLPDSSESQRVATAFHRNTMTNLEGGTDDEEHRLAAVIDRVNTTWEVWQGTTIGCTQCHGHPYDPFRHEEYYSILAFFNNTTDWDQGRWDQAGVRLEEPPTLATFSPQTETEGEALLGQVRELQETMEAIASTAAMQVARRDWESQLDDPEVAGTIGETWKLEVLRIVRTPEPDRDDAQRAFIRFAFAEASPDAELNALRERRSALHEELWALEPLLTPIMQEVPGDRRRTTHVFERGNFLLRTGEVSAGVPASMPSMPDDAPRNRLGLARWLVDPANPLTARVIVNRFWEQLFGIGIVETSEDFGTQGLPPSHPQLLDWLALQFVHEHEWSVKSLLRQIVTSATYQQSSVFSADGLLRDPRNRLLGRGPRFRLTAEQIRDQVLAVSGLLDGTMYGPSVMPPQPEGLWQTPYDDTRWETAEGPDRYRRALYTYWRRSVPYPSMTTFDSPSREFCVSRRVRTNTPLQALVTLNDPAFVEAAQALAHRMLEQHEAGADAGGPDAWLATGFRLALGRESDHSALSALRSLYDEAARHYGGAVADRVAMSGSDAGPEHAALTVAANAILNLDAFLAKE